MDIRTQVERNKVRLPETCQSRQSTDGLIAESKGHFDAADYQRQLNAGDKSTWGLRIGYRFAACMRRSVDLPARTTQGHARQRKVERAMGIEPTRAALDSLKRTFVLSGSLVRRFAILVTDAAQFFDLIVKSREAQWLAMVRFLT
jgi:hypothetical protein